MTTSGATTPTPEPAPFDPLYIIAAVCGFLLLVGVVVVVCIACCVHRWKKNKKEGTWTSPNYRNGKVLSSLIYVLRGVDQRLEYCMIKADSAKFESVNIIIMLVIVIWESTTKFSFR